MAEHVRFTSRDSDNAIKSAFRQSPRHTQDVVFWGSAKPIELQLNHLQADRLPHAARFMVWCRPSEKFVPQFRRDWSSLFFNCSCSASHSKSLYCSRSSSITKPLITGQCVSSVPSDRRSREDEVLQNYATCSVVVSGRLLLNSADSVKRCQSVPAHHCGRLILSPLGPTPDRCVAKSNNLN